jgi:hypothetical protein
VVYVYLGLDDKGDVPSCFLEADQGDSISGKVTRSEVAQLINVALGTPEVTGKTFELRRSESVDAQGKEMTARAYNRMFLKLALGKCRAEVFVHLSMKLLWVVGIREGP